VLTERGVKCDGCGRLQIQDFPKQQPARDPRVRFTPGERDPRLGHGDRRKEGR
jgi:hypothetical protein